MVHFLNRFAHRLGMKTYKRGVLEGGESIGANRFGIGSLLPVPRAVNRRVRDIELQHRFGGRSVQVVASRKRSQTVRRVPRRNR